MVITTLVSHADRKSSWGQQMKLFELSRRKKCSVQQEKANFGRTFVPRNWKIVSRSCWKNYRYVVGDWQCKIDSYVGKWRVSQGKGWWSSCCTSSSSVQNSLVNTEVVEARFNSAINMFKKYLQLWSNKYVPTRGIVKSITES